MTKGPDGDKSKRNKDRKSGGKTTSGGSTQKNAGQNKNKKKTNTASTTKASSSADGSKSPVAPTLIEEIIPPHVRETDDRSKQATEVDLAVPEAPVAPVVPVMPQAPVAQEEPKRKVAKTMIYDTASLVAAAEAAEAAANSEPTADRTADPAAAPELKRKVAKTMLYDTTSVLAAAASAEAQAQGQSESTTDPSVAAPLAESARTNAEPSAPPVPAERKVSKTILYDYDPSSVVAAAAAAQESHHDAETKLETETKQEAEIKQEAETKQELQQIIEPPSADLSQRRVPKTLLYDFDPSSVVAAAEAAAAEVGASEIGASEVGASEVGASEVAASEIAVSEIAASEIAASEVGASKVADSEVTFPDTAQTTGHKPKHAAYDDPPPELNIDAPPVRLFFEDPLPPEKTKRRVPRTLLYNPIIGVDGIHVDPGQPMASARPEQSSAADTIDASQDFSPEEKSQKRISTKKIAKTLLYRMPTVSDAATIDNAASSGVETSGPQPEQETALDPVQAEKYVERYIARTMLDHEILYRELGKKQLKMEEKAEELAKEKANAPFKPFFPIECNKKALPCPWTWDESQGHERYRYCGQCQRPVYNFAGLEIADAEEIIFKAENLSKFTLYKRTDGKFMTSDCPVAVKKKSDTILMTACGLLAAVVMLVYMATLPKPKQKATTEQATTGTTSGASVAGSSASSASIAGGRHVLRPKGSGHYIPGKGFVLDNPADALPGSATSGTMTAPVRGFQNGTVPGNTPGALPAQTIPAQPMPVQPPPVQPPPVPSTSTDDENPWVFNNGQTGNNR